MMHVSVRSAPLLLQSVLLLGIFSCCSGKGVRSVPHALSDLHYDDGALSFTQLLSELKEHVASGMMHTALYNVMINVDIEVLDGKKGVSMVFDKQEHQMRLDVGLQPADAIAWGNYDDTISSNGWSALWLQTTGSSSVANDVKMYAAGYLEGILTCVRLSEYYSNNHALLMKAEAEHHSMMAIKGMLQNEIGFVKIKSNIIPHIMTEQPADPYMKQIRYMLFQLWGLADGYNYEATHFNVHTLTLADMFLINSGGEMGYMMQAYTPQNIQNRQEAQAPPVVFLQKTQEQLRANLGGVKQKSRGHRRKHRHTSKSVPLDDAHWEKSLQETGHCSAFVRLAAENSDIMIGHATWSDYSDMTRVFKYYNFPLNGASTMAWNIGFSSYPGVITSLDSYYVMDSGLVVMDTTLEDLDEFSSDKVTDFPMKPHVPNFMHIMATNRLAKTATHWTKLFATVNTGTYNSQWMIVDYNLFIPGSVIPDNVFWILESIPGAMKTKDLSHRLRSHGWWGSFNRPYFDDIRAAALHDAAQESTGSMYSWADNPRATIFRREGGGVERLMDMRGLMRHNLYPYANVEPNEPGHEIAARFDLSPTQPIPNGAIDAKVTSYCLFKQLQIQAASGPTHDNQPIFRWTKDDGSEAFPGFPHTGLPDVWNFDYVQMTPSSIGPVTDIVDC